MNKKILQNDGLHISRILETTTCNKHEKSLGLGEPCFLIIPGSKKDAPALLGACGARIKRAGFNGTISPTSFQSSRKYAHKKKEAA